jgi:hypothetical protein
MMHALPTTRRGRPEPTRYVLGMFVGLLVVPLHAPTWSAEPNARSDEQPTFKKLERLVAYDVVISTPRS